MALGFMNKNAWISSALMVLLEWTALGQTDIRDGRKLYLNHNCQTCHGVDGKVAIAPTFPNLCGQNALYLKEQAIYIRDGVRRTPQSASMMALVAKVSDKDFEKIGKYLQVLRGSCGQSTD